ncbi:hypothetical protein HKD37_13G038766 [Glycine soja]
MAIRFLTWFLFVSCIQAISSSEQTLANANPSNSKTNIVHPVDKYGIITEDKHDLSYGSRTRRGHGAYGGQDVNHRPSHNSATSFLPCISTLSLALASILLLPFYLL